MTHGTARTPRPGERACHRSATGPSHRTGRVSPGRPARAHRPRDASGRCPSGRPRRGNVTATEGAVGGPAGDRTGRDAWLVRSTAGRSSAALRPPRRGWPRPAAGPTCCSAAVTPGPRGPTGPGRNGVSHGQAQEGRLLIFGVDAEEQGFNPTTARFDDVGVMYARTVFDPLAIITADGGWAPYLAQSIVPNATYSSWTITLRPTVYLPRRDAAATATRCWPTSRRSYHSTPARPGHQADRRQHTSDRPLAVHGQPEAALDPLPLLPGRGDRRADRLPRWPRHDHRPDRRDRQPDRHRALQVHRVGPQRPLHRRPPTRTTGGQGLPYLDSITFKPIPDYTARADALQSGTINMMITDTPQRSSPTGATTSGPTSTTAARCVGEPDMDCVPAQPGQAAPFNNPTVRLAVAKAISTSGVLARSSTSGSTPPPTACSSPGRRTTRKTAYPAYDPPGAKKLVQQVQHRPASRSPSPWLDQRPSSDPAADIPAASGPRSASMCRGRTVEQNELIDNALVGQVPGATSGGSSGRSTRTSTTSSGAPPPSTRRLSINMARNHDPRIEAALQVGRTSTNARTRARRTRRSTSTSPRTSATC